MFHNGSMFYKFLTGYEAASAARHEGGVGSGACLSYKQKITKKSHSSEWRFFVIRLEYD